MDHESAGVLMRESAVDKAVRVLQAGIGVKADTEARMAAKAVLRKLPAGVPVDVVREAWRWTMTFPTVYHTIRRAPDERFELIVAGLESWKSPASTFFQAVLAADRSPAALQAANQALYELDNLPQPYAPSGQKRIKQVMKKDVYAAAVRATCSEHCFHPRPIYPGEKGWKKGAKSTAHAGIVRGICECGGYEGEVLCFFRALVYEGGRESAATLRRLLKASPDFARFASGFSRFAKSPEMVKLYKSAGMAGDRHHPQKPSNYE